MSDIDYLLKILVLGDSSVGKTCLLLKFCDDRFVANHAPTIGIDFRSKTVQMNGKNVKIQLWDTAGQERFKAMSQTLYSGVLGIALVYSVDNRKTFQNVENWMSQIREHAGQEVSIALIANKCDLDQSLYQVDRSEGLEAAKKHNVLFFETSAKTGANVQDLFIKLTSSILQNIKTNPWLYKKPEQKNILQAGNQNKKPTAHKEGGCCK